jgi:hypothetical protein
MSPQFNGFFRTVIVQGRKGAEITACLPVQPRPSASRLVLYARLGFATRAAYTYDEGTLLQNSSILQPNPRTELILEISAPFPPCNCRIYSL